MPSESTSLSSLEHQAGPDIRFRELFEQAPVSIQILAPDGRTLRVNKAWEDLWQIRAGSALRDYIFGEYNVLQDPQLVESGIAALLQRAFAGESVQIPAARYDVAALGGAGRRRAGTLGHRTGTRHQGRCRTYSRSHADA